MSLPRSPDPFVDWQALVRALLLRVDRPAATVEPDGTVSLANYQLAQLLVRSVLELRGLPVFRALSPRELRDPGFDHRCEEQLLVSHPMCLVAWVCSTRLGRSRLVEVAYASSVIDIEDSP